MIVEMLLSVYLIFLNSGVASCHGELSATSLSSSISL